MRPRGHVVAGAIVGVTPFVVTTAAAQSTTRPYDAPIVSNTRTTTPPRPPSYLEQTDAGFVFVYHPAAQERLRAAIPVVMQTRKRMRAELGRDVLEALEIRIGAIPDEMRTLGPTEDIAHYAPAIAFSKHRLVVTSLGSPRSLEQTDLGSAISHAVAHVALDEMVEDHSVPLWFHEGYAAYVAGEGRASRAQVLVMAALQQRLLGISEMNARFPMDAPESSSAYAHAADLTRFLLEKPLQNKFTSLLERTRKGEHFEVALEGAYGARLSTLENDWHRNMARRYGFLPVFLAAMGVWAFCAAAIFIRRLWERRQARPEKPIRESAQPVPDMERVSALEMAVARAERLTIPSRERGESMGATIPPEAEVPKVEHEGDWHTLH